MIRYILVVCVDNICRSPMAEVLLKSALRGQDEITVESAGFGALVGHPAAESAICRFAGRHQNRCRQLV